MALYSYIASGGADAGTVPVRGTITADSPRQARDQLRTRGLVIREITPQEPHAMRKSRMDRYLSRRQVGNVTGLLQELLTLLGAGIPLLEALDTITRQHKGRFQRSILMLREHVAAGGSLAEAMAMQPALFDELTVSIVDVGENAGTLDTTLGKLVDFRRKSAGLKNRITSALMYPAIVLAAGLVVSIFLMAYVVPNLLSVLVESGKELPTATVVVKGLSDFLLGWWWALVLAGVAALVGLFGLLRTDRGLMIWHRMQLKVPLVGDLVRKQAIARMSMVMATLLKSGLMFVRAVQIARKTVRNKVLCGALETCEKAVVAGQDISAALESTQAFPPLVIQIFAVGQASGQLDEMLDDLAVNYDAQVDVASGLLTTLLEPITTIMLAIVVGFIVFATILPILEAGNVL